MGFRSRIRFGGAALAVVLCAASALPQSALAQTAAPFGEIDGILASLSEITGWRVKQKVATETLSREEFAKIIEESVKESEGDKDTYAAELVLKLFGLVPWDFDLVRESADLLEEQTAAFYDHKKKRLVMLEGSTPASDEPGEEDRQVVALAHELAHALADQQFGLERYMKGAKNDDDTMARQSVVEGQAHWLSWAYMVQKVNGRAEIPRTLLEQLSAIGATGDDFPVLTGTPAYVRDSLLFPYTEGMRFQDAVFHRFGKAGFTQVFREAPLSTQEILHPDAYDDELLPVKVKLPDLKPLLGKQAKQWKRLVDGDVGEFDYAAILRQYGHPNDGDVIASKWRGAAYAVYEHKQSKQPLLVHSSEWSTPKAAEGFARAYLEVLRGKWQRFEITQDLGTEVRGIGDRGSFLLRISGTSVQCFEGVPPEGAPPSP